MGERMKSYKGLIILFNLAAVLVFFHFSVMEKENLLKHGRLVLLELAPVDPRSLIQGDYMRLRYKIGEDEDPNTDEISKNGYCVVQLQSTGVAHAVRFQDHKTPLHANEYLIKYTKNGWRIQIGAESFFFQEGQADAYGKARYGGIKIDKDGNSVLTGLYDKQLKEISVNK
jgi:uncharacterized membrane-anchored protein